MIRTMTLCPDGSVARNRRAMASAPIRSSRCQPPGNDSPTSESSPFRNEEIGERQCGQNFASASQVPPQSAQATECEEGLTLGWLPSKKKIAWLRLTHALAIRQIRGHSSTCPRPFTDTIRSRRCPLSPSDHGSRWPVFLPCLNSVTRRSLAVYGSVSRRATS
ncbi:MAG: hypothetical protein BWY17_04200 [Deltaproteobacteria bacterium ADurb.Bin207]|nr:MAG: hypothetical protein BWY17_04200 [Deltaproteobacteria bacterium ADurb.Bin207]